MKSGRISNSLRATARIHSRFTLGSANSAFYVVSRKKDEWFKVTDTPLVVHILVMD